MLKRAGLSLRLVSIAVDVGLTVLALYLARLLRLTIPLGVYLDEPLRFTTWHFVLVPAIWLSVFLGLRLYDPGRSLGYLADMQSLWAAVTMASLVLAGVSYLFFREFSRLLFAYFLVLDLALLTGARLVLPGLFRRVGHRLGRPSRVLIVGAGQVGAEVARAVRDRRWAGLELVGYLDDDPDKQRLGGPEAPVLGGLEQAAEVVRSQAIDEVIVALPPRAHAEIERLVLSLQSEPTNIHLVPDVFSLVFIRASFEDLAGIPLVGLREPAIDGLARTAKRLFDLALSVIVLVPAAPLMALIALAIRLDSPGPILFRQMRVGEGGRPFQMLKFRTMVAGAEQQEADLARDTGSGPPRFEKRADDPRITRLGRLLRRWSLDELPQLWNVLRGEMSLVGPRPELPWLVARYEPWQRKRFAVPQGMTGWWQVHGRSERGDHDERVEDDLYYIHNWSFWLDVRILLMTAWAVVRGQGAY